MLFTTCLVSAPIAPQKAAQVVAFAIKSGMRTSLCLGISICVLGGWRRRFRKVAQGSWPILEWSGRW